MEASGNSLLGHNMNSFKQMIHEDDPCVMEMMEDLRVPKYTIGDLGIDRNTFTYWLKKGLIPFQNERSEGWRRFSFLECIWLKVILEFRTLGLAVEKIKMVGQALFDQQQFLQVMREELRNEESINIVNPNGTDPVFSEVMSEMNSDEAAMVVEENQLSVFYCTVASVLLLKDGFGICLGKNNELFLLELGPLDSEMNSSKVLQAQQRLLSSSFIIVNIWPLILELLYLNGLKIPEKIKSYILSEEEQKILVAIRSGKYTEIRIAVEQTGEPINIKLTKTGINSEAIAKLFPYLQKGKYKDICFKARDGQLLSFEETEIVKFKDRKRK